MDAGRRAVELVIQTASAVLVNQLGAREAVTLLATQAPHARSRAAVLVERDPVWSATHAELLESVRAELARRAEGSAEARDLRAVVSELDRVVVALRPVAPD